MQLQCSTLVHNMNIGYAFDAAEENMIKQVFFDNAIVLSSNNKNMIGSNNNNICKDKNVEKRVVR